MPATLTSFVGREAELGELSTLIHERRLVTLTGAGGIGKTRTAVQVARALAGAGDDGICFVSLAPIGDASLVAGTIAATLGVQEVPNHPPIETLVAYLRNKTMLLVLDNCEHVIEEAATVAETLIRRCPCIWILATSRERLRADGEHVYRLDSLSESAGIALFNDRARAVDRRFTLTDRNKETVKQLCASLDGIPLAIELAATRVNILPLEALAESLNERLPVSSEGNRTGQPRQQAMRATIEWSYNLLLPVEQCVFERLSVFAGGCTVSSARKVCASDDTAAEEVPDALASLVNKSLVAVDFEAPAPRYRLLESFRHYARERLIARGEYQLLSHRHALACLELAEWAIGAAETEPLKVWWAAIAGEEHNFRAALQWSLQERHDVPIGLQLAGTATRGPSIRLKDGRHWVAAAFALVEEGTPREVLAALHYVEAWIAINHSENNATLVSSKKALAHYRALDDRVGMVLAQCRLGEALFFLGHREEAEEVLEEALGIARSLHGRCRRSLALLLQNLAMVTDDVAAGRRYVAEALKINEGLGDVEDLPHVLIALAICEFRASNVELSLKHATAALAAARAGSYARVIALNWLSRYLVELSRYDDAEKLSHELILLAREYHLDIQIAWTLDLLASIAVLRPEIPSSRVTTLFEKAAYILGFVNARLEVLRSGRDFVEQPQHERVLAKLRDAMGADKLAALMAAGLAMTEEQAVEEALRLCTLPALVGAESEPV